MVSREKNPAKGEGKGPDNRQSDDPAGMPMDRFKSLTKKLLSVTREQMDEQQRLFEERQVRRRKDKG